VRPGDEFQVLYERLYRQGDDGLEEYVRPGRILAARYEGAAGSYTAVYFEPREGRGGYYRPDGTSVERQFLMAPLRHARISSSYSSARRHPILKVTRPHHGIDYAAPSGTPVWAVADGEVIYRARAGGFGNLVKIRHSNGYVSYYAHLSRFAKGLKLGQKVAQKQIIGYVGQTGLATGPHVCFRIAKNGQYVNPARLRTPAGEPVPQELFSTFRTASAILLAELDAGTLFAAENPL
jgi:murein DD-endopeptidase MepM/ murein hydrolase activator NlpD